MATTKRKSQSMSAGITGQQYEESLAKYAANYVQQKKLSAEMEEQITQIRDEYDSDLNILDKEQDLLLAVIKGYCVQNKASMFGDKKSLETLFGKLGFRKKTPSLKLLSGFKWEDVVENLKEILPGYVRTIEEANKEKILADRDTEAVSGKLATLGIKVSQYENFFIELKEEVQQEKAA